MLPFHREATKDECRGTKGLSLIFKDPALKKELFFLLTEIMWFDYTRYFAAMLVFFWGMLVAFSMCMHSSGVSNISVLAVVTSLSLCIFSGAHIVACFRDEKLYAYDSWLQRYASDVNSSMLFVLDIAFFQYFFEGFVVWYTLGAQYAYSHAYLNSPITEQTMNAVLDLRLQDIFCSFMLTKMPLYLIAGSVIGYIRFVRKPRPSEEANLGDKKLMRPSN